MSRKLYVPLCTAALLAASAAPAVAIAPISTRTSPGGIVYALVGAPNFAGGFDGSSWTAAQSYATSHGGNLAIISSDPVNSFLWDTFNGYHDAFWIGLNDVSSPGTLHWPDATPVAYTNWNTGEPVFAPSTNHGTQLDTGSGPAPSGGGGWSLEPVTNTYPYGIVQLTTSSIPQASWALPSSANFSDSAHWTPAAPTSSTGVIFNQNSTYTVTCDTTVTTPLAVIRQGTVGLNLANSCNVADLYVGSSLGDNAAFNPVSGSLTTNNVTLGQDAGSVGTMNIPTSVTWTLTGDLTVGAAGNGVLNVAASAPLVTPSAGFIFIGNADSSSGQVSLAAGTSWTGGTCYVGHRGSGILTLPNNASLSLQNLYLGGDAGGHGTVNVSGGTASLSVANTLEVGTFGSATGNCTVSSGATLYAQSAYVADATATTGTLLVTDNASSLSTFYNLIDGNSGNGTFTVAAGASATLGGLDIGYNSDGRGLATITGSNSLIQSSGDINVGNGGQGQLTIQLGGSLQLTGGSFNVGLNSGATGTVSVNGTGSSLSAANDVNIGPAGNGSFTISNGASATFGNLTLGSDGSTTATLTVTGTNSSLLVTDALGSTGITSIDAGSTVQVQLGGSFQTGRLIMFGGDFIQSSGKVTITTALIQAGGTVTLGGTQTVYTLPAVSITSGATSLASHGAGAKHVLVTGSLIVISTGQLDLTDNALIVHNGNLSQITTYVRAGYASGAWNKPGIITSLAPGVPGHTTGLGVISGGTYLLEHGLSAKFYNQPVVSGDVLIAYTYTGDVDLDGVVTLNDYRIMDAAYLSGTTSATWSMGDFNFDGVVNYQDYALADAAFALHGGPLADSIIAEHGQDFGAAYLADFSAAVPEPATLWLLTGSAVLLLGRRTGRSRLSPR